MKINYYDEIKNRFGNIKRAKGFYLYTEKNIRLVDLFLDNGMSIFGRRANQSPLVLKQFVDRGLLAFLPSQADRNLEKALTILFPDYKFKLCSDYSEGLNILDTENTYTSIEKNLWRPFLKETEQLKENKAFFVQPPICTGYKILAVRKNSNIPLEPNFYISASEKAYIARAFFDLIKKINNEKDVTLKEINWMNNKNKKKQILKNFKHYKELCKAIEPFWNLKDMYLFPKMKEEKYKSFFKTALDNNILISPYYEIPSILPKLESYTELLNFFNIELFSKGCFI